MLSETTPPEETNQSTPLRADELVKTFRQGSNLVKALNGVSLSIQKGEFTAIMGPSGCGKSTLLHVMAGLTRPDSGAVWVEGEKLSSLSDAKLTDFRRRRIGLVFQQFNLVTALTALENVMLPLMAEGGRGSADAQDRARHLLDRLGLGDRLGHRPDAMSGGEQQRVAIARALVTDPAIILADEPTGSLDSGNGNAICSLLRELNQEEGRSIVMVTHEPAVAAWAGRVVVMKDGAVCSDWNADQFPDAQSLALRYQEIVSGQAAMGAV
ncbi:peptide ABC transporter ATP-binding protein [Blastopirellula marina]|uniref:Peptide ABC transporter ATP-binding protein n=1 Tax=Blastopirellula marina TaxID=124 RepID=A0A2S8F070_9BACT|nr:MULTISPECIES: ABC transporter ATP-binding protein [Pirellulaceae]PQO25562.1 peptide ABC transporter ATP-binding protein [Blastopirellula marina]RCS42526.1 ABC transporter ATP-binding protein [Bremerella cremea]